MLADEVTVDPHPTIDEPEHGVAAETPPDELDIDLAQRAVQIHCAVNWPSGLRCNNCHGPFPCVTHQWGVQELQHAGWSEERIALLDRRIGPWS